jgi:outer membrane protein assembly factor BamD (BamD/ComL family)
MTISKLMELQRKLDQLRTLIGSDNHTARPESVKRLARFIMLNPNNPGYANQLDDLLSEMGKNDPLRDNVLLAQIKLIPDEQLFAEKLAELHTQHYNTDGGMQALYELCLLKIRFWQQQDAANSEQKKKYLTDARATLTEFLRMYPNSFPAEQVKKNLANLPAGD